MTYGPKFVRWFKELNIEDVPIVGGKNASLGEMYQELVPQGILVPNGFAVTAEAYRAVLDQGEGWSRLREALEGLDPSDVKDLARRGALARDVIYGAGLPEILKAQIVEAYRELQKEYGAQVSVAVRSSATAEDLPTASFAGQQDTFLNVSGEERLLETC